MAAKRDKVVYLKTEEKNSIKAYVVDYVFDTETGKTYVIVAADSKGTNAKVYEIIDNEAFVLSKDKVSLFQAYKTNDRFQKITSEFKDGLTFNLLKKEEKKKETQAEESFYYVFDQGTLRSYKADMKFNEENNPVFSNIHFIQTWKKVKLEDIATIIGEQNHGKSVFLITDKINDMEFTNGNVTAIKWSIVDATLSASKKEDEVKKQEEQPKPTEVPPAEVKKQIEPSGEVIYYVFDHDIVRAYQANAEFDAENIATFKNVQCIGTWRNQKLEDIEKIISEKQYIQNVYVIADKMNDMFFENGTIKAINWTKAEVKKPEIVFYVYDGNVVKKYKGNMVSNKKNELQVSEPELLETIIGAANLDVEQFLEGEHVEVNAYFVEEKNFVLANGIATLKEVRQKKKEKEKTSSQEDKIILMNGDIDVWGGKTHYSVLGCVCTVKSRNPFTIVAERSGIKTITFESENSNSVQETCQAYQNLYPNVPVYLSKGIEIFDSNEHVLEEKDYVMFTPQKIENKSLLTSGKKVLTEEEMEEKRQAELQELQKKRTELSVHYKTPIADAYLVACPQDYAFASYIRSLENAGMEEVHMRATGLWETIQKRMANLQAENQPIAKAELQNMSLSKSFRKHYMIVKNVNDDILRDIEKMESFGHTPLQIADELDLPTAMIEQLKSDIPELSELEPIPTKPKAM